MSPCKPERHECRITNDFVRGQDAVEINALSSYIQFDHAGRWNFCAQLVRTYAKKLSDVNAIPDHFLLHSAWKKFEPILEDARTKGEITPQLREHLHDPAMGRMHLVEMAGVVFAVNLMVFKPF